MEGETLTYKLWRWSVTAAAVWWFLGLNLFIYQIVTFFLFMGMLYMSNRASAGLYFPPSTGYILCIAVFYFLSIFLHVFFVGAEASRVIAALYNLSFWIMGFMLIMVLSNAFSSFCVAPFMKTFTRLAWMMGVAAAAMLWLWRTGHREVIFETPLYFLTRFLGDTQLVESSLLVRPLLMDWFASANRPRFNMFSPYPTASGAITVIVLAMILTRAAMERQIKSVWLWILVVLNLIGLVMTLSRMSLLAFVFGGMAVFLLQKKNMSLWILLIFGAFAAALPLLQQILEYMLSLREGSNDIRMQIYVYSLQQLQGPEWILGYGVKPRDDAFMFPLGSHSTYISSLFKCGLMGLTALIGFQVSLLWRWYKLKPWAALSRRDFLLWRACGWVFIGIGLWLFTEDIDAPQLLAFLYFSVVGVFEGFRRRLLQ